MDSLPDTIVGLQSRLAQEIGAVLKRGTRVALLDFPNHSNVGDSAIWLGERALLRRLGCEVVYGAAEEGYSRDRLARRIGDGVVALHGGGNLGDLWPDRQTFRERVLRDFPNNVIVQLPQSVWFDQPTNANHFRELCKAHGRFVLFVRDGQSRRLAQDLLGLEAGLAPDCAMALGHIARPRKPSTGIVYLRRTDKEAANAPSAAPQPGIEGLEVHDWLEPAPFETAMTRRVWKMARFTALGAPGNIANAAYLDYLATLRVRRGVRLLSRGGLVITDRLHAMLLSILAGIPVIALDNRVNKLSAYCDSWMPSQGRVPLVASFDEALSMASQMRGQHVTT